MGKPKLFRMRSPCFGIQWISDPHYRQGMLLISGGGGSAKSGVQNQIVGVFVRVVLLAGWCLLRTTGVCVSVVQLLAPFSREDNAAEHTAATLSTGSDLCTGMLMAKDNVCTSFTWLLLLKDNLK